MKRLDKKLLFLTAVFTTAITAASLSLSDGQRVLATVPGTNTLVSANIHNNAPANGGNTIISANGKYVAFESASNFLVNGDSDTANDVFVRNLATSTTTSVSVSSSGVQSDNWSTIQAISETGRYIVFRSTATNLIDGTTIPSTNHQIYVRDTATNTTRLVTKDSSGNPANDYTTAFDISEDGRFILLASLATNLNTSVTNAGYTYYMYDDDSGAFTPLNYAHDNSLSTINGNSGVAARMSCDGAFVVFIANNLTAASTSHSSDIHLLDRRAGNKITNITINSNAPGAISPTISCNGNYIGFASYANNLDPGTGTSAPTYRHAYVYDRIYDTFTMADKSASGAAGNNHLDCNVYTFSCVEISNDGIATFTSSWTTNLTSPAATGPQVYVKDLDTGAIELLSRNSSGNAGNSDSNMPRITADGSKVSYDSYASNLVSLDTDNNSDSYTSLTGY